MNGHADSFPLIPDDEWNAALLGHAHPPGWVNPVPADRYNLVVVGGGTAGLVSAAGAAGLGARVALVERHLLGGDCLNVGCVPSKAVIASARRAAAVRRAATLGVGGGDAVPDFAAVMARMRRLRAGIAPHDSAARFRSLGVDLFLGEARFVAPDRVAVGDSVLRFARAVVATGSRPSAPDVPGLADSGYLTNQTVFSLTACPARLVVIGGGPIGVELSQAFARLGSRVTLATRGARLLPRDDADAAAVVAGALVRDGVEVCPDAKVLRVTVDGRVRRVEIERGGSRQTIETDAILVATGRTPNVEGLDLEAAGIEHGAAGVVVDDRLRTSNPRVYAAGDVCLGHKFTHAADASARIVVQNALFFGRKRVSALVVPWCTYCDPEVAHVGETSETASAAGRRVDVVRVDLASVDRAVLDGDTDGFVKVVLAKGTDRIVGATVVAPHAGETISELTLAIVAGRGLGTLASVIHPYPTVAEAIRKAADAHRRTRLTPFVARLLRVVLALRR